MLELRHVRHMCLLAAVGVATAADPIVEVGDDVALGMGTGATERATT